ncbi:MAG: carboxypeptidase-like regulatory domain-containing protein [Tannerellaceae bacterium]|jgi:hypothetical protein|nr:carboxypeptidase-like regulatory domain-containing protein [Tannerellaceae bacterium]
MEMKPPASRLLACCLSGWLLLAAMPAGAQDDDPLNGVIRLPKSKGTVYQLLEKVTDRSGYFFIYDSRAVDNEQAVRIKEGDYTIRQAIYDITGNSRLILRVIGSHILLQLPATAGQAETTGGDSASTGYFAINGLLIDRYTKEPVPFASLRVVREAIGTVANLNGEFRLRLPDSLRQSPVQFSHLGYQPLEIESDALTGQNNVISLDPKVIPLQEVVVRLVNPLKLLREMLDKRPQNYAADAVYLTSFYREGVEKKKGVVNLTEAVFKVYKTAFGQTESDQVKLLKMRRISNEQEKDTLIAKIKAGINASLTLDMVKHLPAFLSEEEMHLYHYTHVDITFIDDRMANVIYFEQRKEVKTPLFCGELYVDPENGALISARFEVNPAYVAKAAGMFIEKKSRHLKITPQRIAYTISYKPWNGAYYINHVRGDLSFKVRKKRQLLGSTTIHLWFEMVTGKIDTTDVNRFVQGDVLPSRTIFSDTRFTYDHAFWDNFNVILPEEQLHEAISKITSKIEELNY